MTGPEIKKPTGNKDNCEANCQGCDFYERCREEATKRISIPSQPSTDFIPPPESMDFYNP